jgi:hypothetical protein
VSDTIYAMFGKAFMLTLAIPATAFVRALYLWFGWSIFAVPYLHWPAMTFGQAFGAGLISGLVVGIWMDFVPSKKNQAEPKEKR